MNKVNQEIIILMLMPLLLSAVAFPRAIYATIVENNISSRASSGGNNAGNGKITEGQSSADVYIETIVDGQTVQLLDEHTEGPNASIEKELNYEDEDSEVQTSISVEASVEVNNISGGRSESNFADAGDSTSVNTSDEEESLGSGSEENNSSENSEIGEKESEGKSFGVVIFSLIKKVISYVFDLF
jgi:hypothetical protein